MQTRRRFFLNACAASAGMFSSATRAGEPAPAGRVVDLRIADGFGAGEADIRAVLASAAGELWVHCPTTRWEVSGFHVYHNAESPITLFEHTPDNRVAIGLNTQGTLWCQFAFQFAHEFCHALAGHSNDWRKTWIKGRKANHWLEESICETASLFALRAMAKSWAINPPYPNWKDYAPALASYADERLTTTRGQLPAGTRFVDWFGQNESSLRGDAVQREKNNQVAAALLPVFEADPGGWDALASFNRVPAAPEGTLQGQFQAWHLVAPARQRPFIAKLARVFELSIG